MSDQELMKWLEEHPWRDGFEGAKLGIYRDSDGYLVFKGGFAFHEVKAFTAFLAEQGLLYPVDQSELILCDERHQRFLLWRDNDIQETECGL
jgi:hypothetical protein